MNGDAADTDRQPEVIAKPDIEEIAQRKPVPGSPVLSVTLDIDQSKASNLDRRFEASLEAMLRSIEERLDETQSNHFSADGERVRQYVLGLEPRAMGLIVFCDQSGNFFWSREVNVPNNARWSETPYVLPLLQLLDEHERYGLVLVDKAYARLFTVFMGDIQEHYEALAPAPVSHVKSTGTDHMRSEDRFQHKAAMHVHCHLKNVAEKLEKLVAQYGFDRLLLAGPVEATAELQRLLPKRIRSRIVERLSLPAQASEHEVLDEVLRVEQHLEREMEKQIVEELIPAETGTTPSRTGSRRPCARCASSECGG